MLKIADINTIIIIHRNKKSVDNIPKFLNEEINKHHKGSSDKFKVKISRI